MQGIALPRYFAGRPARPGGGKATGPSFEQGGKPYPLLGGALLGDPGFRAARGPPGGSARALCRLLCCGLGQSGGGREVARPAGAGPAWLLRAWLAREVGSWSAAPAPLAFTRPAMERLTLPPGGAAAVDDYLEYRRIVGEDDGGKLFTPEEYEEYKRKVLPMRLQNRLFVSWRSPAGMDCKLVGPETLCFCTHRYKQHKTDFETIPQQRPIGLPCRVPGCPCRAYLYIPLNGAQPIRCRCKHFADQHSAAPGLLCNACSQCSGFHSCFTCVCGQPAYAHDTVVETKQERLALGKPVGRDAPYAAMGGLTGFSSLAEGYMRLDDSGIGVPSVEFLDSPVMAVDHPFLKAFQASSSSSPETLTDGTSSQVSSLRRPEEDDMAFFERRYQERTKIEKAAKQKGKALLPSSTKPS
ncbi:protein FAM221A isoform X2 [Manis javanica]|uniref:protein FAM221A isoform X2 n=1 Tax=Manis javanica TaxID=9974 RepID=UPI003C6CD07E